jgi:hypothetical protein
VGTHRLVDADFSPRRSVRSPFIRTTCKIGQGRLRCQLERGGERERERYSGIQQSTRTRTIFETTADRHATLTIFFFSSRCSRSFWGRTRTATTILSDIGFTSCFFVLIVDDRLSSCWSMNSFRFLTATHTRTHAHTTWRVGLRYGCTPPGKAASV